MSRESQTSIWPEELRRSLTKPLELLLVCQSCYVAPPQKGYKIAAPNKLVEEQSSWLGPMLKCSLMLADTKGAWPPHCFQNSIKTTNPTAPTVSDCVLFEFAGLGGLLNTVIDARGAKISEDVRRDRFYSSGSLGFARRVALTRDDTCF